MIRIRKALADDVPDIAAIEALTFGEIGEGASATSERMRARIALLNADEMEPWFFVAVHDARIVGYVIMQPTDRDPYACRGWADATDNGTLERTFVSTGPDVYIVSFGVRPDAPIGTAELLLHATAVAWARRGGRYFFVSRMPGYRRAFEETGIDPRSYVALRHPQNGGPRDPMLYYYWLMSGKVEPYAFLENGFPPDDESMGHGVLFVLTDPHRALSAVAEQVYHTGVRAGMAGRIRNERRLDDEHDTQ